MKALQAARESLLPGGIVLVMDENIDELLNVSERRSTTVLRRRQRHLVHASRPYRDRLRSGRRRAAPRQTDGTRYHAGFHSVEILPIEHPFWKFYQLKP